MKNRVDLNYTNDSGWTMTIINDLLGEYKVDLPDNLSMAVALALSTVAESAKKAGYEKAKKKYKAINDVSKLNLPWSTSDNG